MAIRHFFENLKFGYLLVTEFWLIISLKKQKASRQYYVNGTAAYGAHGAKFTKTEEKTDDICTARECMCLFVSTLSDSVCEGSMCVHI